MGTGTTKKSEAWHKSLAQAPGVRDDFRIRGVGANGAELEQEIAI